jgi:hypothetical protein
MAASKRRKGATDEKIRFKLEEVGAKKKGGFFETRVGLVNVYKRVSSKPYFDKRKVMEGALEGYNLLKKSGLPVTESKKIVVIRGEPRLVFEKARDIRPEEVNERLGEIVSILKKANKNEIYPDVNLRNFGINSNGKIVIRDTNFIAQKGGKARFYALLENLESSISKNNPHHRKAIGKIKELKKRFKDENRSYF